MSNPIRSAMKGLKSTLGNAGDTATAYFRDKPRLKTALVTGTPYIFLLLFLFIPLFLMVLISFRLGTIDGAWTLENYVRFFTTDLYLIVLWRTFIITLQVTVVVTVLGYVLTYSIVRFSRRTTLLLLLIILPFWTSYIIRMYAWINILQTGGVLDTILILLNITSEPSGYLFSREAVLVGFTYVWLPLAVLPFYASLANMDESLIDASKDLGAGPIRTFFNVTLPMTANGIIVGIILVAIPTFGAFITPTLLGGTDSLMIGMVVERQFTESFNWPFGAAVGTILAAIIISILVLASRKGMGVFAVTDDFE